MDTAVNWRELNRKLDSSLAKNIAETQKKRLLVFFSVKKSCQLEITKNIRAAFLEFVKEQPECAFMNTRKGIAQSIHQLEQEIKEFELAQFDDSWPSYYKMRLKTTNAELTAFEYWLRVITNMLMNALSITFCKNDYQHEELMRWLAAFENVYPDDQKGEIKK